MEIEFIEQEHLYLIDGVIVPSVSQIVGAIYPNQYDSVPAHILRSKAEYGTRVHELIEKYILEECFQLKENNEEDGSVIPSYGLYEKSALNQFIKIKHKHNLCIQETEQMVSYQNLYAGRYDLLTRVDDNKYICDIKTYATMDNKTQEKVRLQLSLYSLAHSEENYHYHKLAIIWIPKGKMAQWIEIEPLPLDELKNIIERALDAINQA